MLKKFALIAEGDVFHIINMPDNIPIYERWWAGLMSDPIFVNCTEYSEVGVGSYWDGSNFYPQGDIERNSPIQKSSIEGYERFACVVENDVFGMITYDKTDSNYQMFLSGISSNPIVVECTDVVGILPFWTWDGNEFKKEKE